MGISARTGDGVGFGLSDVALHNSDLEVADQLFRVAASCEEKGKV